ncbi:hypothetical protein [Bradyrhizobium sp. I1.7.5]|uniref:hypothetical protein n=1 Tax=Bradyrhizobium sp. I1.7.5 TaxID=3156363 RepID=UPI00339B0814
MKPPKRRLPRPPVAQLSATSKAVEIAAQEARIIRYLTVFRDEIGNELLPEGGHRHFEDFFFEKLVTFDPTVVNPDELSPEDIVKLARDDKHPAADRALFRFADKAMVVDRFQELPMPVREYIRERMRHGQMSQSYPPRTPRVVEHFVRDCAIAFIFGKLRWRLPGWPPYGKQKKGRRSAAALVGEVFGLEHVQVRRIYESDDDLVRKIGAFFASRHLESFGTESNV